MDISVERYTDLLVGFLEKVGYSDPENPGDERVQTLCHVFRETMGHFMDQADVPGLTIDRERLTCVVRTITRMTVFGFGNLPLKAMVALTIYFTYVILEDDPGSSSTLAYSPLMESFACDLLRGRDQAHPRYRLLFSFFPDLLCHYGQYSQLTMIKSNLELIQGFWIESQKFKGLPGSSAYPMFLRRLNGLGDFAGAALFPTALFDEHRQFEDIVTVVAQIEPVVTLVNDLFSFYKEASDPAGDICLVENISTTKGLDTEQVLHQIADDSVQAIQELTGVLEHRRSLTVLNTVRDFVQGYIRWHLCDERYRMRELSSRCGNRSTSAVKFRRFHEMASRAGCTDRVEFHAL